MHMFFRNLLYLFRGRWGKRGDIHGVGRLSLRVWPIDLDVLGHMNNGVYLSIMDLGRMDLLVRADAWRVLNSHGIYPIVASVFSKPALSVTVRRPFFWNSDLWLTVIFSPEGTSVDGSCERPGVW
jgi:hypothetical protein